jgi:hypothetical protein
VAELLWKSGFVEFDPTFMLAALATRGHILAEQ